MTNPFRDEEDTEAVLPPPPSRQELMIVTGDVMTPIERSSTIGSAERADVVVAGAGVSRLHARLEPEADGLWITDLDSTNGTFVNGVRVGRALLTPGARVRLGNVEVRVEVRGPSRAVPLWRSERFGPLLGRSHVMRALFDVLSRVAPSEATVLIGGETGTGKDVVARAIHEGSPRASGPFVVFDCAAVPESLFESELFGHARGAFTGADRPRDGAALAASGGTLFLDEVGELPASVQPKLLRMLETKSVRKVGESRHQPVDVRIVAATHRDLAQLVARGAFREDLYFRLAVIPVTVPPLRERRDDVPLLLRHFLGPHHALTAAEERELAALPFLGNVRELRSIAERLRVLGTAEALRLNQPLAPRPASEPIGEPQVDLEAPLSELREQWLDRLEKAYLSGWLAREPRVSAIADRTGLNRTYLHRLLRKHDLGR